MGYKKSNNRQKARGRQKGVKNLIRTVDAVTGEQGFINQKGIYFTAEEKKALEKAVRKSNRKSDQMKAIFDALPYKEKGVETGMTVGERRKILGKEHDFSISDKTASLQRFESHEEFEKYMKNLNRVNSPNYVRDRARLYKRNYEAALRDPVRGLGLPYDEVSDILMKIRTMKPEEYLKNVASNEELEIGYIYDNNVPLEEKLNSIRSALGLKHREIDSFWDGDEYE